MAHALLVNGDAKFYLVLTKYSKFVNGTKV